MKSLYLLTFLFSSAVYSSYAQKTVEINSIKVFEKARVKITSEVAHITVCSDLKLSKNCKNYFQSGTNEFSETALTNSEANSISKQKGINGIRNIGTEKITSKTSIRYLDKANSRIYFIGSGKNLNIAEYTTTQGSIARKAASQENIKCRGACFDRQDGCINDCYKLPGTAVFDCIDACTFSYLGCAAICDKYKPKYHLVLNDLLLKPVTIQTK
ncbi:MAG: hypothetical protein WAS55_06360 [Saprospiraceae bacterium]|nr:hypothetical protein [Saprospiraceae bacterium]MBK9221190.1 hypothetical protein [Saprospiraceae bacterium]